MNEVFKLSLDRVVQLGVLPTMSPHEFQWVQSQMLGLSLLITKKIVSLQQFLPTPQCPPKICLAVLFLFFLRNFRAIEGMERIVALALKRNFCNQPAKPPKCGGPSCSTVLKRSALKLPVSIRAPCQHQTWKKPFFL